MPTLAAPGGPRRNVALFPLQTVLFPGGLLPLRIFETRYMDMARGCLRSGDAFGICLIREGPEVGAPAVPEPVGCLARIVDCDMQELGILKVRVEGTERFRVIATRVGPADLVMGDIEPLHVERAAVDAPGFAECAAFLRKVIPGIGAERFAAPLAYDDASWVGFRVAEILPLRNDVKQKLLELTDASMRLAFLHQILVRQGLS